MRQLSESAPLATESNALSKLMQTGATGMLSVIPGIIINFAFSLSDTELRTLSPQQPKLLEQVTKLILSDSEVASSMAIK